MTNTSISKLLFLSCILVPTALIIAQVPEDRPNNDTPDQTGQEPQSERGPFGGPPLGRFGGGRPGGFGPGAREPRKLLKDFDEDDNGWLNEEERAKARVAAKESEGERRGFGPPGGQRGRSNREPAKPGRMMSPWDVKNFPNAGLYDMDVLRTIFIEFENDDWEKELEDFHGTDVDVAATLFVDGEDYSNVGVRFRGMSSYGMTPYGYKRSFNISMDMADEDQRLYGYKTLNLLNCAGDASFMNPILYSQIANQYIPAPKANHVRVVVNGECWGIYVNVQQFNKDFLKEHFESTKGTRWKVSGSPRADGGLRYLGDDLDEYKQRFEMKSNDGKKAWQALVQLCKTLNETPLEELEEALEPMLDIDSTLRFLALDVALVNRDGYWTRSSDYSIFLDNDQRFHVIPHDMNEAFAGGHGPGFGPGGPPPSFGGPGQFPPGGPGRFGPLGEGRPDRDSAEGDRGPEGFPPRGFGPPPGQEGPEGDGGPDGNERGRFGGRGRFPGPGGGRGAAGRPSVDLDPLVNIDNLRMPLRSRLLAIPKFRKQYLAYVKQIAEESLDWQKIAPIVAKHRQLIESEVEKDTRKLESYEAFQNLMSPEASTASEGEEDASLRSFFEKRRQFLLSYEEPTENDRSKE